MIEELEPNEEIAVVTVMPRESFLKWAREAFTEEDDETDTSDLEEDLNAYLIPAYEDDDEMDGALKNCFTTIFENELAGWCSDPARWPKKRDFSIFKKWFFVKGFPMVFDVSEE